MQENTAPDTEFPCIFFWGDWSTAARHCACITNSCPAACMRPKMTRFLTLDHFGTPTLKIKMLKIVFVLARQYKKIGLEPNLHEPMS